MWEPVEPGAAHDLGGGVAPHEGLFSESAAGGEQRPGDGVFAEGVGHGFDDEHVVGEERDVAGGAGFVACFLGGFGAPVVGVDDGDGVADAEDELVGGVPEVEVVGAGPAVVSLPAEPGGA